MARIPCPAERSSFEVRLQRGENIVGTTISVQRPLVRRGNVIFYFVRDLPEFNGR